MNIFHNTRPCPKCGGKDMVNWYHKADECRYGRNECRGVKSVEHIQRTCQRCHYQWAEFCVDSVAEPESEIIRSVIEIGRSYKDSDQLTDLELDSICTAVDEATKTTNGDIGKVELSARQVCLLMAGYYAGR